jgi:hypothetical protein
MKYQYQLWLGHPELQQKHTQQQQRTKLARISWKKCGLQQLTDLSVLVT